MSSTKPRKPTKAEIEAGCRRYDRRLKASGATWHLELVLTQEGDEKVLATLAQYKNLKEITPNMRRKVVGAARAALGGGHASLDGLKAIERIAKALANDRTGRLLDTIRKHLNFWERAVERTEGKRAVKRPTGTAPKSVGR